MISKISPFAPEQFPTLPPLAGFEMATAEAGLKYEGRTDLWVLRGVAGTKAAAVFTKNKCPGAPIDWSRRALQTERGDAPFLLIVNSGTANVFSGQKGRDAVVETAEGMAKTFGGSAESVFICSTGVIGQPLEAAKVNAKLPYIYEHMQADGWEAGARAIMTTDTYAKGLSRTVTIDGETVTINGIVKGSGMIAPDMATMLGYIATDANIEQTALQDMLSELTETSFNSITVDSDTSTSDTVMLMASCQSKHEPIVSASSKAGQVFLAALKEVMQELAFLVVKDGEGISKFLTVNVSGAVSDQSAKNIGLSIANSPLVKTAVAGEDANWGRIVMAVGKAGEPAERDLLTIRMGPHILATQGELAGSYSESDGEAYMKQDEIVISVDMGLGEGKATVWTCDLTHGYIEINADYRS